jgi:hypothetical protein
MAELKAQGVKFEEYDTPGLTMRNSIVTAGRAKPPGSGTPRETFSRSPNAYNPGRVLLGMLNGLLGRAPGLRLGNTADCFQTCGIDACIMSALSTAYFTPGPTTCGGYLGFPTPFREHPAEFPRKSAASWAQFQPPSLHATRSCLMDVTRGRRALPQ